MTILSLLVCAPLFGYFAVGLFVVVVQRPLLYSVLGLLFAVLSPWSLVLAVRLWRSDADPSAGRPRSRFPLVPAGAPKRGWGWTVWALGLLGLLGILLLFGAGTVAAFRAAGAGRETGWWLASGVFGGLACLYWGWLIVGFVRAELHARVTPIEREPMHRATPDRPPTLR